MASKHNAFGTSPEELKIINFDGEIWKIKRNELCQEYLEYQERDTKTLTGEGNSTRAFKLKQFSIENNAENCPVTAYKTFRSHRPESMNSPDSPFYLSINTIVNTMILSSIKGSSLVKTLSGQAWKIWLSKQICLAGTQSIVPENLHVQKYYMLHFTQQQFNNWQGTEMNRVYCSC